MSQNILSTNLSSLKHWDFQVKLTLGPILAKNFSALASNCVEQHGTFSKVKRCSTIIALCYDLLVSRPDTRKSRELAVGRSDLKTSGL